MVSKTKEPNKPTPPVSLSTAVALSVNSELHHAHRYRRQHSAVSMEEMGEEPDVAMEIDNGTFSWDLETRAPSLTNINIQIPKGAHT